MRFSLAAVVVCLAMAIGIGVSQAQEKRVDLGGVAVAVPAPSGFVDASLLGPEVQRAFGPWVPPESRIVAVFVSEEDAARWIAGESANFDTYLMVQILRANEQISYSDAEYGLVANLIRNQYGTIISMSEDRAGRLVEDGSKQVSDEFDIALDMKLGEVRPLGVFLDRPRAIAFSTIVKYDAKVEGEAFDHVVAGSTSFVLAKGRLLYAYVYRTYQTQEDLDRVRLTTHDWIDQIVAANN